MAYMRANSTVNGTLILDLSSEGDLTDYQSVTPVLTSSGVSSVKENNNVLIYITNYDAEYTYTVTGDGAFNRSGDTITWTVPTVGSNSDKTISVISSRHGEVWSDGGIVTVSVQNATVDTPTNTSPTNGQSDIELDHTFEFSDYSDDNTAWSHASTQIQIDENAGDFSSPVLDEIKTTGDLTVYQISEEDLANDTTYKWRVRYKCDYDVWSEWSSPTTFTTISLASTVGVFSGGSTGSDVNTIDQITINSTGNATDFGDLTVPTARHSATSNGTNDRGIFGGGAGNTISYITISNQGDAIDFGDLTDSRYQLDATSNATNNRGVFIGGIYDLVNTIDYITISSVGDALDFGDAIGVNYSGAACSNGTDDRAVWAYGAINTANNATTYSNTINYFTISNTGNSLDFGDLTVKRQALSAVSNGTNDRGVWLGGYSDHHLGGVTYNTIDYVTVTSTGNASDFGDLVNYFRNHGSTSNMESERGVIGGGNDNNSGIVNIIEYITINSAGNSSDFGDLTVTRNILRATSNA
jgi:hypothetical protein